ncbi:MAG: hypothetical protein L0221_01515, partial [Chloroflexi bacterium]|nr:hypothetical protein [Chloroflexota bacterium]
MSVSIRDQVRATIAEAWQRAEADGALPLPADGARPTVEIERPAHPEHGDLATNLALKLARPLRMRPPEIAAVLAAQLGAAAGRDGASPIASAEVAGPGFLNLRLADAAL